MNALRLIIIFNLTFLKIFGQGYFSFIDTNSVWRDLKVSCGHGPSYLYDARFDGEYFLKGDTIIGKSYSKLYFTGNRYFSLYDHGITASDTNYYCNLYVGGLREDSLKHVFYKDTLGFERTLFNFNLHVGDYVIDGNIPSGGHTVSSIDSVLIYNQFRKRINFNMGAPLIEGIGYGYGILGVNRWTDPNWLCPYDRTKIYFYKNSKAYRFTNTGHPEDSLVTLIECNSVSMGVKDISRNIEVKVYPNPTRDLVSIEFSNSYSIKNAQITIMDNVGRVVLQREMNSNFIKVDLSALSDGIYFLKFHENSGNESIIKLVKIKS